MAKKEKTTAELFSNDPLEVAKSPEQTAEIVAKLRRYVENWRASEAEKAIKKAAGSAEAEEVEETNEVDS